MCDRPVDGTVGHHREFRLHVPNQNDVSPRVFGSASRQTAWASGSTGSKFGSTRIPEQTDGRRKKRRWSSQHPTPRGSCSILGPGCGRRINQAHLDNRDRASTSRPFARERSAGVAGAPSGDQSSAQGSVPIPSVSSTLRMIISRPIR